MSAQRTGCILLMPSRTVDELHTESPRQELFLAGRFETAT